MAADNLDTADKPADKMARFLNEICILQMRGGNGTISGRVIDISSPFLTLQHQDGHISLARVNEIALITTSPKRVI